MQLKALVTLLFLVFCTALQGDNAPIRIEKKIIKFFFTEATGEFSQYKKHSFKTTYLKNNIYCDKDLSTGVVNDTGSYHYFKTGEDSAEVHYHVDSDSPWKNMHLIEKWTFISPNEGHVKGVHSGDFDCGYVCTFVITDEISLN